MHLGKRLDEGVITWSGNTMDKTLALIKARTADAVTMFLKPGYVERVVRAVTAPWAGRRPVSCNL